LGGAFSFLCVCVFFNSALKGIAQREFAKRFERGKLSFTGDVLQVISVVGRQQKFANLLKQLTVGA
jgi:hypothetical protein